MKIKVKSKIVGLILAIVLAIASAVGGYYGFELDTKSIKIEVVEESPDAEGAPTPPAQATQTE